MNKQPASAPTPPAIHFCPDCRIAAKPAGTRPAAEPCDACGFPIGALVANGLSGVLAGSGAVAEVHFKLRRGPLSKAGTLIPGRAARIRYAEHEFWQISVDEPSLTVSLERRERERVCCAQQVANLWEGELDGWLIELRPAAAPLPDRAPPRLAKSTHSEQSLDGTLVIGSAPEGKLGQTLVLNHTQVAASQLAILPLEEKTKRHVAINLAGDESPMWVNGKPARGAVLQPGDLIQVGPYAWAYTSEPARLVPGSPLAGERVDVHDLVVGERLSVSRVAFEPGKMTAITGPSGCGKSTLLKAIAQGIYDEGRVCVGGVPLGDTAGEGSRIVYVPQSDATAHEGLPFVRQAWYAAHLSGQLIDASNVTKAFDAVGLSGQDARKPPDNLSGGEFRRARLASAVIRSPGIILVDEPDSGLDAVSAAGVFQTLKSFALRGATVVVVTHAELDLKALGFDEKIALSSKTKEPDRERIGSNKRRYATDWLSQPLIASVQRLAGRGRANSLLLYREIEKLLATPLSMAFSLVATPLLFALAVGVATPAGRLDLLGVLSLLAVTWMGASASCLAIASEEKVYRWECTQFITSRKYLTAKASALSIVGAVQSVVYSVGLLVTRWMNDGGSETFFHAPVAAAIVLVATAVAAVQLGLLVSVACLGRPQVASTALPLLMMVQVLFSQPILLGGSADSVGVTYGQLTLFMECEGRIGCPNHNLDRFDSGTWLCGDCERLLGDTGAYEPTQAAAGPPDALRKALGEPPKADVSNGPVAWPTYLTLTRYGDMALRSFAYYLPPRQVGYWVMSGAGGMLLFAAGCLGTAWLTLRMRSPARMARVSPPSTDAHQRCV